MTKGSTFGGLAFETLYLWPSGLRRSRKETFWRQSSKIRGLRVSTCQDVTQSTSPLRANLFAPLRATSSAAHLHVSYAAPKDQRWWWRRSVVAAASAAAAARPPPLPTASRDQGNGEKNWKSRKWKKRTVQTRVGVKAPPPKNPIFINRRLHMNLVINKLNKSSLPFHFLFFYRNTTRTIKPPGTASLTISVSPLEVIMQRQASVIHQEWIIPR